MHWVLQLDRWLITWKHHNSSKKARVKTPGVQGTYLNLRLPCIKIPRVAFKYPPLDLPDKLNPVLCRGYSDKSAKQSVVWGERYLAAGLNSLQILLNWHPNRKISVQCEAKLLISSSFPCKAAVVVGTIRCSSLMGRGLTYHNAAHPYFEFVCG